MVTTMSAGFRCRSLPNPRSRAHVANATKEARAGCASDKTNPFAALHKSLTPGRIRDASRSLLISRARTPAMATPFASAAAGIVNRCRSLLTPCVWPPGERRRDPTVPGRGRMLARFVYFAPGRTRLAGACKSLLISFAGTPATAAPLAQPGAAGIVNRCRSLQIQPRERRREPAVPRRARAGERGRDAAVASLRGDCRRRRPPR